MDGQHISGTGNIVVSGVSDSTISIAQYIGKSAEYGQMVEELKTREEFLSYVPDSDIGKRLELSRKVEDQRQKIESFKRDVLSLAETFSKIEINTERLQNAKEFFDSGRFKAAQNLLKTEEPSMAHEQKELLAAREDKTRELEHIAQDLRKLATEYLIFAETTALDYENPHRFEDTCERYEQSVRSSPVKENLLRYAIFLQNHNQFARAGELYSRFLQEFETTLSYADHAAVLNNLAILHINTTRLQQAEEEFSEILRVYRALAEENPRTYLPNVAMTLNNLANLHANTNRLQQAEEEYSEALKLYRGLAEENPRAYLPNVATTLNNLAVLHRSTNRLQQAEEEYGEALKIRRDLAEENPRAYLPDVAMTLNNLANLHADTNQLQQAEEEYGEALKIRRGLAEENPRPYLPDVAWTLINLAVLHANTSQLQQAEEEFGEALKLYRGLAEENPRAYLPNVAWTLNNLAVLRHSTNRLQQAEEEFGEALKLYRGLAEENPRAYLPNVAGTLINLSIFHIEGQPEKEKSVTFASEAVCLLRPMQDHVPSVRPYLQTAITVLRHWGVDT